MTILVNNHLLAKMDRLSGTELLKIMVLTFGGLVVFIVILNSITFTVNHYTFGTKTVTGDVTTISNNLNLHSTDVGLLTYSKDSIDVDWFGYTPFNGTVGEVCSFTLTGFNLDSYNCSK